MGKLFSLLAVLTAYIVYSFLFADNFDPKTVSDKRVLITGASSGIGEHLAYEYSKLGARVFITARRANLLEAVANKCRELGAKQVEFVASDLGQSKDRAYVIEEVKKRFNKLDILILNHATLTLDWYTGSKKNLTSLLHDLNVNFVAYVDLASQALPILTDGNIAVVSSVNGKFAPARYTYYSTGKFALHGFFTAFRQDLFMKNMNITVALCVIGLVDTDIGTAYGLASDELKSQAFFDYLAQTPKDTALAIMKGIANKEYEIYFGKTAFFLVQLHRLLPNLFEYYASAITAMFPSTTYSRVSVIRKSSNPKRCNSNSALLPCAHLYLVQDKAAKCHTKHAVQKQMEDFF